MKTLHIAPGDSAGGSLARAIRDAGRDEAVLRFRDDLSCGPINPGEPSTRALWWNRFYNFEIEPDLVQFWQHVGATDAQLVVWFGRHSASELAFFHAFTDRLNGRPCKCIDVTGLRFPRQDGSDMGEPMQSVSIMNSDMLRSLLGREAALTPEQRDAATRTWRKLKTENAPFRIVTATGLVSAPADYFDHLLLMRARSQWRSAARVIAETMGDNWKPYIQVGDLMLLTRLVTLVRQGKLIAEGDPWDRACRVRLPA